MLCASGLGPLSHTAQVLTARIYDTSSPLLRKGLRPITTRLAGTISKGIPPSPSMIPVSRFSVPNVRMADHSATRFSVQASAAGTLKAIPAFHTVCPPSARPRLMPIFLPSFFQGVRVGYVCRLRVRMRRSLRKPCSSSLHRCACSHPAPFERSRTRWPTNRARGSGDQNFHSGILAWRAEGFVAIVRPPPPAAVQNRARAFHESWMTANWTEFRRPGSCPFCGPLGTFFDAPM